MPRGVYIRTEYHNKINSEGQKGKCLSEEQKEKISCSLMGHSVSEETRRKIRKSNTGKVRSEKHCSNLKKIWKDKQFRERMKEIFSSDEYRLKLSKALSGIPRTEEWKQKISLGNTGKKRTDECRKRNREIVSALWKTKQYQESMSQCRNIKPTKPELKLQEILNDLFPNEYKYVGNFKVWFGGKNPDFINVNGKKKLIEFFGEYWHKAKDEPSRIAHFKKYGFDTLVVWESELKDIQRLVEKLIQFNSY